MDGRRVVSAGRFDLDDDLRYSDRAAALVEPAGDAATLLYSTNGSVSELPLTDVAEATIDEALGVDRLVLKLKAGGNDRVAVFPAGIGSK